MAGEQCAAYERLLAEMTEEFAHFRLIPKSESSFQKLIHGALVVITLGQMRSYMKRYHTTLGQRIYVPPSWEEQSEAQRYVVLCHERVHMRQFRRYTWPGMALLYLLVPLPMGLAYCRARFEMEAYAETIRAAGEMFGAEHVRAPGFRAGITGQFKSASYAWMWPFKASIERWYERALAEAGL